MSGYAWLDATELSDQQKSNIRTLLTIHPSRTSEHERKDPEPIELFFEDEDRDLFGVPYEFYKQRKRDSHEETLKVSDGVQMREFDSLMTFKGEYAEQETAIDVLYGGFRGMDFGGQILHGKCGFGKTNAALELAHRLGRRTLILAHKEFLMNQWRRRIAQFYPGARVGIVRQSKCEYRDVGFVVAMLDSLVSRVYKYPKALYDAFGLVISDEVHRVGAETWAPIIPRFNARYRLGLTATPRRKDDAENVFFQHIGPIVYSSKTTPVIPMLRIIYTETELRGKMERGGAIKDASALGRSEVVTQLSKESSRTRQLMEDVFQAVKRGRKILVLSERLEHLQDMARDLNSLLMNVDLPFAPVLDFYTGDWFTGETDETGNLLMEKVGRGGNAKRRPKTKRRTEADLEKVERANVIFATMQMVQEGLDIQALDVELFATPLSDVEQAVGRLQRVCLPEEGKCKHLCPWRAGVCPGKPQPILVDAVDEGVPKAMGKWRARKRFYREAGIL